MKMLSILDEKRFWALCRKAIWIATPFVNKWNSALSGGLNEIIFFLCTKIVNLKHAALAYACAWK